MFCEWWDDTACWSQVKGAKVKEPKLIQGIISYYLKAWIQHLKLRINTLAWSNKIAPRFVSAENKIQDELYVWNRMQRIRNDDWFTALYFDVQLYNRQ